MKLQIKKDSIDKTILIFIQDSSSTTGAGLTGLAYNTSGLACYYCRPGSTATQLTLANQTVTGSHTDGGFVEIDSTNMSGVYRLDLSDAICASGVDSVVVMLKGASNMAPLPLEIQLIGLDLNDAVRGGMSALPNAAADAAGGLPISDAGGLDLDSKLANTNEVTAARMGALTDLIDGGRLDLLIDAVKSKTDNLPADPADDSDIDAQLATIIGNLSTIAGYIDTEIQTLLDRLTAARAGYLDKLNVSGALAHSDAADTYKANVTNLDAAVSTRAPESGGNIAAIKAKTDSLNFTSTNVHAHVKVEDNIDFGTTKKTSIETAVQNKIEANDLDNISKISAGATKPTDGSYLDQIMNKDAGQTFDSTTDSLEALQASTGITQQQVRDAMKLAPTAGAPAAGSIDKDLDLIKDGGADDFGPTTDSLHDIRAKVDTISGGTPVNIQHDSTTIVRD